MTTDAEYRALRERYGFLFPPGTDLDPESLETRYNRAYIFARAMNFARPHAFATVATFKEALR